RFPLPVSGSCGFPLPIVRVILPRVRTRAVARPGRCPGAWSSHTLADAAGGARPGFRRRMRGAEADNHREGLPVPVVTMKQLLEAGGAAARDRGYARPRPSGRSAKA